MSSPKELAKLLTNYHLVENSTNVVNIGLNLSEHDNEYRSEVLMTILKTSLQLLPDDLSIKACLNLISKVFLSLNFHIKIEPINFTKKIVYLCKISKDGNSVRNPFHPFCLREMIINNGYGVPSTQWDDMFYKIENLSNVKNIHENFRGIKHIVTFSKI